MTFGSKNTDDANITQTDITSPSNSVSDLEKMVSDIIELKMKRNSGYTDSPLNILPDRYWLAQIVIKAVRAEQSNTPKKMEDELDDLIVYALLEKLKLHGLSI